MDAESLNRITVFRILYWSLKVEFIAEMLKMLFLTTDPLGFGIAVSVCHNIKKPT